MAAGPDVGRHEVGEGVFLDVLAASGGLHGAVILDVHPAEAGLHRLPLLPDLRRREALDDQVGGVEHEHEPGMVHAAMNLGEQLAGAAHEVGLHLEPEREVGPVAGLGDPADLLHRLLEMVLGLGVLGGIEGESPDQLRLEGVGELAGLGHVLGEILLERHVGVLRAVGLVEELDLADGRGDRGHVEAILVLEVADLLDLRQRELHDVLHALAHIDVPQAVVLEAERRQRRELLDGRKVKGGLVGEGGEKDGGLRHG